MNVILRLLLLLSTSVALSSSIGAQGSVVEPGPNYTLYVNGAPFYPLGWALVGSCLPPDSPPGSDQRASVAGEIAGMRRFGVNTLMDLPFTAGRLIPYRATTGWYNWYNYTAESEGQEREVGHARPGVYVEAMRWLMDQGIDAAPSERMYSFVSITSLIAPGRKGTPYNGSDRLPCAEYRAFIEEERRHVAQSHPDRARRIPSVSCTGESSRPFWEWNVWYIVHNLRDHPGLLGWYLYDEPEGIGSHDLFGIVQPEEAVPAFAGPGSLPTPDLLRYAYNLVKRYETEGRSSTYPRHPILVDVYLPDAFFSQRYMWSRDGAMNPLWHTGPFDRTPEGTFQVPADILGLDASNQLGTPLPKTGQATRLEELGWWPDPNLTSATSAALREATQRDELWSALAIQAQAQLTNTGPYAIAEPLRCGPNPSELRARLLSDRLLIWQLLTHQINGLRGQVYYAHYHLPTSGEGAEMESRIDRLMAQFRQAGLDHVFATPEVSTGWALGEVTIHMLTNFYRNNPYELGSVDPEVAGRSSFDASASPIAAETYRAGLFGRSDDPDHYGETALSPPVPPQYPDHRLLRPSLHRLDGRTYFFLSNAYDARISADVLLNRAEENLKVEEGAFNLNLDADFGWKRNPTRTELHVGSTQIRLRIDLEPYEVRLFRW